MASIGLYFYRARYYDPALSRFTSADFIIPGAGDVQAWDRYAFVNNNPLRYNDPSGHYGKDVHYDLTYQVVYDIAITAADERGYSPQGARDFANNLASEVGRGDMAADVQNPDGSYNLKYVYNQPVSIPTPFYKTPHWYTTPEAENELASTRDPFAFGVAMHKYQDSFSHWQKLGKASTPAVIWLGHFTNNLGPENEKIDKFDPLQGYYKDIDQAMLKGMTSGFAYDQTQDLARYQLDKLAHPC